MFCWYTGKGQNYREAKLQAALLGKETALVGGKFTEEGLLPTQWGKVSLRIPPLLQTL